MIPLKVTVENFLSFGTPAVEFDFNGEPLWILCGPNGTGKSAVFDAITYVLFGHFRGSTKKENRTENLIHHGAPGMRVEFEFEFGGVEYRVTRKKSQKGPPKVGVARRTDRGTGVDGWELLGNINGVREFEDWVAGYLGLSFNTFVCSVLLRQGKAEEIIDADKDTRLKVLHGIIDFERFVELHTRVASATTDLSRDVRKLQARLEGMKEVTDHELTDASKGRDDADGKWVAAQQTVRDTRERLGHARTWDVLQGQREAVQAQLNAAAERAQQALAIERQAARLRELREVICPLSILLGARKTIAEQVALHAELTELLEAATTLKEEIAAAIDQERLKVRQHGAKVADLDRKIPEADARMKGIASRMKVAEDAAGLRRELDDLAAQLDKYPTDLEVQVTAADSRLRDAQAAREAATPLESLTFDRATYRRAVSDREHFATEWTAAVAERRQKEIEVEARRGELAAANKKLRTAELAEERSRTRVADLQSQRAAFSELAGAETCSLCRQPIDEKHAESERQRLADAVFAAEGDAATRHEEVEAARKLMEAAEDRHREQGGQLEEMNERCRDAAANRDEADRLSTEAATRFQRIAARLPEPYRGRVGRIELDGFPTTEEVVEVQRFAETADALDRDVRHLRQSSAQYVRLTAERNAKQQSLDRLGDQPSVDALITERDELQRELDRLRESRKIANGARQHSEQEEQRLSGELKNAETELVGLTTRLAGEDAARSAAEQQATTERRRLPTDWQLQADVITDDQLKKWTHEQETLVSSGIEQQVAALADDRALQTNREEQLRNLNGQIDQLPVYARRPPKEIEADVEKAELAEVEAQGERTMAANQLRELKQKANERMQVTDELDATGKSRDLHDRLADLLGKKGLQRDLVRDAEREIVDLANETLSRVSNGDLRLERPVAAGSDDDTEAVFDLSVRQSGKAYSIGLAFLSGSQRFRVAVALALAVGRFASRQARPLEAVIIDEGFGCLDRIGRLEMIEELQRLQRPGELPSPLKRIILVSHHEDFFDSFPVGYKLSNETGTTEAEMFRK